MKIYARIEHDRVAELLATSGDIGAMFHRDLRWIDVTGVTGITLGWRHDGAGFAAPGIPIPDQMPSG